MLFLTDEAGFVANEYRYDAYGRPITLIETVENPYLYTAREFDPESGLYHYRARAYDPETGRFLQEDPIHFAAGDLNLYRYVFNNPVNATDPDGLIVDTALDAGLIGYDIGRLIADNVIGDCGNLGENLAALGLDIAGAAIPFATGLGPAFRAAKGVRGAAKGKDDVVDLYRAVGPNELADIQKTGAFRNPPGLEGKYFTTSGEQASAYAREAVKAFGDPPYTIVHTQAPRSVVEAPNISVTVEKGIEAYQLSAQSLPGLKPNILNFSPIP